MEPEKGEETEKRMRKVRTLSDRIILNSWSDRAINILFQYPYNLV
jgi:hypothetical protein